MMAREQQLQRHHLQTSTHLLWPVSRGRRKPYPVEDVDFISDGGYSGYNWELFFHVPLMIAMRLAPISASRRRGVVPPHLQPDRGDRGPAPQKYWVTKPFFLTDGADYLASASTP